MKGEWIVAHHLKFQMMRNPLTKVFGQDSEGKKKRDKLIELIKNGTHDRSSITGNFKWDGITFTLGSKAPQLQREQKENGVMELSLTMLTLNVDSFHKTTRITSKIVNLSLEDLSSQSSTRNCKIIKQSSRLSSSINSDLKRRKSLSYRKSETDEQTLLDVIYEITADGGDGQNKM